MRKIVEKTEAITDPALRALLGRIHQDKETVRVTGLNGSSRAYIMSVIQKATHKTVVVITGTVKEARQLHEDIAFFSGNDKCLLFPPWDILSADLFAIQREVELTRTATLWRLALGIPGIVVVPFLSLLQRTMPRSALDDYLQIISMGDTIDRDILTEKLVSGGYRKTTLVEEPGEFSIRGHVIDVFPVCSTDPVRMEFFGDEVESIRLFDPSSQRSIAEIVDFQLSPAREAIITEARKDQAVKNIRRRFGELDLAKAVRNRLIETMENNWTSSINPLFLPLFYTDDNSLPAPELAAEKIDPRQTSRMGLFADFISPDSIIVFDDLLNLRNVREATENEIDHLLMKSASDERFFLEKESSFVTGDSILEQFGMFTKLDCAGLSMGYARHDNHSSLEIKTECIEGIRKTYHEKDERGLLEPLITGLRTWMDTENLVIIVCGGHEETARMTHLLSQYGLDPEMGNAPFLPAIENRRKHAGILLFEGRISASFHLPVARLVIITVDEIFGKKANRRPIRTAREGYFLKSFGELNEGDYVVHTDHGIGQYRGLQKLMAGGIENDFLLVEYQDKDKLYLPVDRLDQIQRYIGPEGYAPKIDKLGGTSWEAVKERVKKSVREVAEELVSIYAAREVMERDAFTPPDRLYNEFCSRFAFEETPDQAKAIDDINLDMNDAKPMDRLVCGDAGFGKTEVALRASFRAVMDGKQVAILVPTTILAEQHYLTFSERLREYPVRIAVLNRLRTRSQQLEIVEEINKGKVDIVIGTHRLLQKDIIFKQLGLVIIDEEQRFGVAHKEKLKKLRTLVDVLTLTATPIPRTLHLSLVGIRDLSIINTPPEDRLPIKTHVLEFDEDVIAEAISREIDRGGQIFFIHDRIQSIFSMARFVEKLAPAARVGVVHGRMKSSQIEEAMVKFVQRDYNVLVCTTIVAAGVDIPTANTIIINRADRFGLSLLYQLRGRVGRSNEEGYAYLLVPKGAMLSRDAQKRLQVIMDFTEPGSGFRIASNDLEIRGAGNMLGISQSGHVSAVGYELYTELMEKTIRELKGEKPPEDEVRPEIQLGLPAFIPQDYMADEHQRLVVYKRISLASTDEELNEIKNGLQDGFGFIPAELDNLLEVIRIKNLLKQLHGKKMFYDGQNISIHFRNDSPLEPARLLALSRSKLQGMKLTPDLKLFVPMPGLSGQDVVIQAQSLLHTLAG